MRRWFSLASALPFLAALAGRARGGDVAVLLSSDAPLYQEALRAFETALGSTAPAQILRDPSPRIPPGTRVAVTFGSRAGGLNYGDKTAHVACFAPGVFPSAGRRPGTFALVNALPPAKTLLSQIKEVQPALSTLHVFWLSEGFGPYMEELKSSARSLGMEVSVEKLAKPEDLAARLGRLKPRPQALWVPPDPLLATNVNVSALLQYSSVNRVPFYAPGPQFAEIGATAAILAGPQETGRAAGEAVKGYLAGKALPAAIYPEKGDLWLNQASMDNAGLKITSELEKKSKEVY